MTLEHLMLETPVQHLWGPGKAQILGKHRWIQWVSEVRWDVAISPESVHYHPGSVFVYLFPGPQASALLLSRQELMEKALATVLSPSVSSWSSGWKESCSMSPLWIWKGKGPYVHGGTPSTRKIQIGWEKASAIQWLQAASDRFHLIAQNCSQSPAQDTKEAEKTRPFLRAVLYYADWWELISKKNRKQMAHSLSVCFKDEPRPL